MAFLAGEKIKSLHLMKYECTRGKCHRPVF